MSLSTLIADVEAAEATLTVFNAAPEVRETLAAHFADRNVRVVAEETATGPGGYAVLVRDGEFLTAVSVANLLPDPADTSSRTGRPVRDHLDGTLFTSYDASEMVAASREIEDRAWRYGSGGLHAGFQTLDVLAGESPTYDRLGGKPDLDVHAYATAAVDSPFTDRNPPNAEGNPPNAESKPPNADNFVVHVVNEPEIRETWFVVYDGDGHDDAKCALLAEEREPGRFFGFWSYDPSTVDRLIDHLIDRYGSPETTDDGGATV